VDRYPALVLLVPFAIVGVLALVLRWASTPGRSLVAGRPRRGAPEDYGLLVPVASPRTDAEAEQLRRRLLAAGIPATVAPTTQGPRLLVFPRDEQAARALVSG
jgi:hypothetical protein